VISAKRVACTLLALTIVAAVPLARQAGRVDHRRQAQGCQAAGAGGPVAALEAADVAGAVQQMSSAPGMATHAGFTIEPPANRRSIHSAFTFARPHDPPHLHAFALLI
jgi:hypothetical protein